MNRRIFGIETEYGITCAPSEGSTAPLDAEHAAHALFASVLEQFSSTNVFLRNGARLYLDVGAHPEYATAECATLEDLLANERAGDQIFSDMAQVANERLSQEGIPGRIHLFKNNLDSEGNSFGCHENYLIRRHRNFRNNIAALIPFFVTRQILVGAGVVRRSVEYSGDRADCSGSEIAYSARYELSPRAEHMWDAISSATTRSRPIVNTRDEPHGDPDLYRRMHVIVGDSNMCQATLALKVGMVQALLNVMEHRPEALPRYELADAPAAIRAVSRDLSGRALVTLASGSEISALDIQRTIFSAVEHEYAAQGWKHDLSHLDVYVFDLWQRMLEALESENFSRVRTEIDWVAKRHFLDSYMARSGIALNDPRISRLELAWHDITCAGLRPRLEAAGALTTLLEPSAVTAALTQPPLTTRARLRGKFVAAAQDVHRDYMADWMNVRLATDHGPLDLTLSDPFCAHDERVDELLKAVERI